MRKNDALFRSAKDIAVVSLMTALLVAAQAALSAVAGIEIVTVLLLSFCYCFGVRRGIMAATCFSLLRCLLWGFLPNVVVLYLVYYNLFAAVFGAFGHITAHFSAGKRLVLLVPCAACMAALFSLTDDVVTPLMLGYSSRAALVYFYNSLPVMGIQAACAAVTVLFLFPPLYNAFGLICGAKR